jgi:hypothetical protein
MGKFENSPALGWLLGILITLAIIGFFAYIWMLEKQLRSQKEKRLQEQLQSQMMFSQSGGGLHSNAGWPSQAVRARSAL